MARRSTPTSLTFASLIYQGIRDEILRGQLKPGQKLKIEALCELHEAGSSPVREALNRLSAEGLVARRDQQGFYVAPISRADLDEIVETRCWVDELALRESMARGGNIWREAVVLALYRLSRIPRSTSLGLNDENREWEQRHRELHRTLISSAGSGRLIRFSEDLTDQAYRYRQLARRYFQSDQRNIHQEHEEIVSAVLQENADLAVRLLKGHYQETAEIVRRLQAEDSLDLGIAA